MHSFNQPIEPWTRCARTAQTLPINILPNIVRRIGVRAPTERPIRIHICYIYYTISTRSYTSLLACFRCTRSAIQTTRRHTLPTGGDRRRRPRGRSSAMLSAALRVVLTARLLQRCASRVTEIIACGIVYYVWQRCIMLCRSRTRRRRRAGVYRNVCALHRCHDNGKSITTKALRQPERRTKGEMLSVFKRVDFVTRD